MCDRTGLGCNHKGLGDCIRVRGLVTWDSGGRVTAQAACLGCTPTRKAERRKQLCDFSRLHATNLACIRTGRVLALSQGRGCSQATGYPGRQLGLHAHVALRRDLPVTCRPQGKNSHKVPAKREQARARVRPGCLGQTPAQGARHPRGRWPQQPTRKLRQQRRCIDALCAARFSPLWGSGRAMDAGVRAPIASRLRAPAT